MSPAFTANPVLPDASPSLSNEKLASFDAPPQTPDRSFERAKANASRAIGTINALDPRLKAIMDKGNVQMMVTDDLKGEAAKYGMKVTNEDAVTITMKNARTGEMTHIIMLSKESCSSPAKAMAAVTHQLFTVENHENGLLPNSPENRKRDEVRAYEKSIDALTHYRKELEKKYGAKDGVVKDLARVIESEKAALASWRK